MMRDIVAVREGLDTPKVADYELKSMLICLCRNECFVLDNRLMRKRDDEADHLKNLTGFACLNVRIH
eukprot:3872346-Pleurochrysis_carterae.AAC.1